MRRISLRRRAHLGEVEGETVYFCDRGGEFLGLPVVDLRGEFDRVSAGCQDRERSRYGFWRLEPDGDGAARRRFGRDEFPPPTSRGDPPARVLSEAGKQLGPAREEHSPTCSRDGLAGRPRSGSEQVVERGGCVADPRAQ
jgi:hypothetical protein